MLAAVLVVLAVSGAYAAVHVTAGQPASAPRSPSATVGPASARSGDGANPSTAAVLPTAGPTAFPAPVGSGLSPGSSLMPSPVPTLAPLVPIGFTLRVPILMYHLIATPAESVGALPGLVVSPALFDAQLARLEAAGWHTITLRALAADLGTHRRPAPRSFVITIDDGHVDGYTEAFPILRRHAMVATYFVIAGRIGHPGDLDADQLRALAAAGMEIGDHSMDHVDLTAVAPAELAIEVGGAAAVIGSVVGTAPVSFAYPFGEFDAAVMRGVARAGLLLAVTERFGAVEAANLRYEIPRVRVGPGTTPAVLLATLSQWSGR